MTPLKILEYGICTDVGMQRNENQDSFGKFPIDSDDLSHPSGQLFIVADGLGGHNGGREASELAIKIIGEEHLTAQADNPGARLVTTIEKANEGIFKQGSSDSDLRGMGTTCSALLLKNNQAYLVHVGDSRIYRINGVQMMQLTNDHTRVADLERKGIITREEARVHPYRSQLYRALGMKETVELDVPDSFELGSSETFFLCSDGILNHATDEEICEVILRQAPQPAAEELVALANERGGVDNTTILIVRISESVTPT